jgi:hypothetical protein
MIYHLVLDNDITLRITCKGELYTDDCDIRSKSNPSQFELNVFPQKYALFEMSKDGAKRVGGNQPRS